jgi:tetratricopeptide (TPR) repeat protein
MNREQAERVPPIPSRTEAVAISDSIAVQFTAALRCHQSGHLAEAVVLYDRILSLKPDLPEVHSNRGAALAGLGRLGEAEAGYRRAIALKPDFGDAYNNLGNLLCDLDRLHDAEHVFRQATRLKPGSARCQSNLGTALKDQGKLAEAEAAYRTAIALEPGFADAYNNLGDVLSDLRRLDESERALRHAIALSPQYAEAFCNLGNTLKEQGRASEAEVAYRRAITLKPRLAQAYNNLGNLLLDLGRPDESEQALRNAIALSPRYAEAFNNRGTALQVLRRLDEALASYDQAVTLKPGYAEAFNNRGNTLRGLKRLDEALASFDQALALKPEDAGTFYNRGIALQEQRRLDEALASYNRALALNPDYAEAYNNRGLALQETKRLDEAQASFDRALALRPHYAEAHFNDALLRLLTGDLSRGWAKYEWRWKVQSLGLPQRNFSQPLWLGKDTIDGETILLHSEQGFGDTIQFCRYVPLVAARGARVILEVERPLCGLLADLAGASEVICKGDPLPDFDLQCPLLSLPLAFGTRLETIPSATPTLSAPVHAVRTWQTRLGQNARPRIGIVWAGRPEHNNDHNRSMSLRDILPILDVDATFVSLHKDVRGDDAAVLNERNDLLHYGDALKDFSDTAGLMSQLDLVISVDTSVAHLAGTLAKPVWVLLPFVPDWRWLLGREDSPWYPTARLFRQSASNNWDAVIRHVRAALVEFIQSRRP